MLSLDSEKIDTKLINVILRIANSKNRFPLKCNSQKLSK